MRAWGRSSRWGSSALRATSQRCALAAARRQRQGALEVGPVSSFRRSRTRSKRASGPSPGIRCAWTSARSGCGRDDQVSRRIFDGLARRGLRRSARAPPPAPREPAPGRACGPSAQVPAPCTRLESSSASACAASMAACFRLPSAAGSSPDFTCWARVAAAACQSLRGRLQLQHGGRGPGQPRIERQRPFGMARGPRPCRRTGGPRRTGRAGPALRCRAIFVIASKMRFTEARSPLSWAAWAASTLTSGSSARAFPAIAACFDAAAASPAPAAMMPRDSDS